MERLTAQDKTSVERAAKTGAGVRSPSGTDRSLSAEPMNAVSRTSGGACEDGSDEAADAAPDGLSAVRHIEPIPAFVRFRIATVRAFLMGWVACFSLSGLYKLGRLFGTLEYLTDYKRRRRVDQKLRLFFKEHRPPSWRRRMTRRYFMRIRCDKMFYTIMDRIPRSKLMKRIKLQGGRHIDEALASERGVYVALCHFGSHHIAGLMMALLGYHIGGVRDPKESHVRRYIQQKYRETFPEVSKMRMFPATSFPRGIYRYLRGNRIVASLLDADRKRAEHTKTAPVRLFGEERQLLIGPLQIAIRCGATTLQGFVVSRRNFYYQLILTPPLIDSETVKDEDEIIAGVLQRYADGVEQFAHQRPDHLMNI